jgi:hypothetical protein
MMYTIKTPAGRLVRITRDQLLRKKKNVVVISRNPGNITGLADGDARVVYLGPWGSATAYLIEPAA